VSEYGHVSVTRAVEPNRALRRAGLLAVRDGPFGEMLDTFGSRAFAVCDHQLAHVYVNDPADVERTREVLGPLPGVAQLLAGGERAKLDLAHPRSGELIALAQPDSWFAYPFWLDDARAPDYARTVNIHAKPGYDPCELLFDPKLRWPTVRVLRKLLQKKLGFRTLLDVVPLDAGLVHGSHGLAGRAEDRPVLIGDGPAPAENKLPLIAVHDLLLAALGVADGNAAKRA
jgi:hypothetical protein